MKRYDPDKGPDLNEWRDLDESERIEVVRRYHRKAGIELPNEQIHAAMHVIVENQIAEGDRIPVRETLVRLMSEGLDRHDALHAIATILAELMYGSLKNTAPDDLNAAYFAGLSSLTAQGWLKSFEQEQ
jgi:hypothetical protein